MNFIPPQVYRSRFRRAVHFFAFFFASQSALLMPASARRFRVASENLYSVSGWASMRVLNQLSSRRSAFLDAAGVWAAPAPASPIPSAASSFLRCSRHFAASFLQKSPISSQHLCGNQIYGAFV